VLVPDLESVPPVYRSKLSNLIILAQRLGFERFVGARPLGSSVEGYIILGFRGLQKISLFASWLWFVFIVYATLTPMASRPELAVDETARIVLLERFVAYALLGFLLRLAYPRRTLFVLFLIIGLAIGLELSQLLVPDRDARAIDAVEKLAGGFVGIWLARFFEWFVQWLVRVPAPRGR
jgi:VanZ family protein